MPCRKISLKSVNDVLSNLMVRCPGVKTKPSSVGVIIIVDEFVSSRMKHATLH